MIFLKIFHRKKREPKTPPRPLRIEGTVTYLTPNPDDAELAAQALLEVSSQPSHQLKEKSKEPDHGSIEYYHDLSERVRKAHIQEARRARRYLAYAEEQLRMMDDGSRNAEGTQGELAEIEHGLYALQDCAEREGGDMKQRWQHCLAEVVVRQMNSPDVDDIEGMEDAE